MAYFWKIAKLQRVKSKLWFHFKFIKEQNAWWQQLLVWYPTILLSAAEPER